MELTLKKSVTKEMFFEFTEAFFSSWKNDQEKDEKIAKDEKFLFFVPKNIMWELKPLAEKQLRKVKKAVESSTEEQLTKMFDNLAQELAGHYWEQSLEEVNLQGLPGYGFCQVVYNDMIITGQDNFETFSRLFLGVATDTFDLHPDPHVD